jgi:serine/threonine-protein kinase
VETDTAGLRERLQATLGTAYTLERELGGGGMSRVFVAEETALGRRVVVKALTPDLAHELSTERFAREVRLTARLQHPNIVPVLTAGSAGGVPYYTMPYVEGESLRARLAGLGPGEAVPVEEAVSVLRDVARALAYAHERHVVHRDIKPENVLLTRDAAVVADFGIAKAVDVARAASTAPTGGASATALTQLGAALGTPAYMAPEQAAGDPATDHRADLYAWGVLAYELLAGQHPFAGKHTAHALIVAHLIEAPPPLNAARPGLAPALVALVTRCLAKAPEERPGSAREVVDLLGTSASSPPPPAPSAPAPSIAVLPFVNLSGGSENEYFSDGISEEVLSVLAQDRDLRVAARSSSFAFRGQHIDLRAVAERLHVGTVLEGAVRRADNRVRITAQLVNAADGYQLWSGRFDRELTDIFAVQDEIANAIASTLRQRLRADAGGAAAPSPPVPEAPTRRPRPPVSVEAYDEYLKGKHANNHRPAGLEQAFGHFQRALALEPAFAAAHAGLGASYLWSTLHFRLLTSEAFAHVRRHAQRALALDSDLADAHWLLAESALWHDWDADVCERHARRALDLEPHHAGALMTTALLHNTRGLPEAALAAAAAAVRADPLGPGTRIWFLALAYNARQYDLAIAEASRLVAEQASFPEAYRFRAMAYEMRGDLAAAQADLDTADRIGGPDVWGHVHQVIVAVLAGRPDEARRFQTELVGRAAREWVPPIALGQVEQALGDYDAALGWYERAYQARDHLMTVLHTDPAFRLVPPGRSDSITSDPRWLDLVRRVGLAP